MRAKAAPPNPDPPGTPMSPFVCVLYRHWLTYYCNLRSINNQEVRESLKAAQKQPGAEMMALEPEEIAQAVAFAIDTPKNMAVNEMVIRPTGHEI